MKGKPTPEAFFDITPELITQICVALKANEEVRYFRVTDGGLPADVRNRDRTSTTADE